MKIIKNKIKNMDTKGLRYQTHHNCLVKWTTLCNFDIVRLLKLCATGVNLNLDNSSGTILLTNVYFINCKWTPTILNQNMACFVKIRVANRHGETKWAKKGDKLQHLTGFADPDHVEWFSCTLHRFGGQRMSNKKSKQWNCTNHNKNV